MPPQLKIATLNGIAKGGLLNEEWIELLNDGDAPFNAEGCSITVARSENARPKQAAEIKAGLIVQPNERVRLVSGSSGKKSHGVAPEDGVRNFHLFLKSNYLTPAGVVVRIANHQLEVCRATYEGPAAK